MKFTVHERHLKGYCAVQVSKVTAPKIYETPLDYHVFDSATDLYYKGRRLGRIVEFQYSPDFKAATVTLAESP